MSVAVEPHPLRLDLGRLARAIGARRAWLVQVNAAAAVVATAVVLMLPRWYAASVTLVPAPGAGAWLNLGGAGIGVGGMSVALGPQSTPQDQLRIVVQSRALADSVIRACGLRERWQVKRLGQAREQLAERTSISTPKEGQVEIKVEARTPPLALEMAEAYARFAAIESVRLKTSLANQRRVYLAARLGEVDRELEQAGERIRTFEEGHGAVSLTEQTHAQLEAQAAIETQVAKFATELAATRRYFTDESPPVHALRDRMAELKREGAALRRGADPLLPATGALPAIKQQYLELTREQASLVSVSALLRKLYEQSRVEEANPVPEFSVLDAPELPERASRPARGLTLVLATLVAVAASMTWAYRCEGRAKAAPARDIDSALLPSREAA